MEGISALSVEINHPEQKVILRVRVNDKWIDLMMDEYESVGLANILIAASAEVGRSVEVDPEEVYNKTREEGSYMSAQQVQEARRNLEVIDGGKTELGNPVQRG